MKRGVPFFSLLLLTAACGGGTPDSKTASDVDDDSNPKPVDTNESRPADDTPPPTTDKPAPGSNDDKPGGAAAGGDGTAKKDECNVFDEPNLEGVLLKSACEVATPTGQPPDFGKKLEVKVSVNPPKVAPGGHADLLVTFANKSPAPIQLFFTIDPMPRFEVEVYDKKSNRVDLPKNQPPPLPAGMPARTPGEPRTARIFLAANGTARMSIPWDAVKLKWAPEKLKGTPPEKGYPRAPAGPLPKGKYAIKVLTPLTNVFEGIDREVSQPLVQVDVSK
jgi:hypothetical protein